MKKILLISDSPYATTGLGRMSKYFLKMLPEFEWVVWGCLHPDYTCIRGVFQPIFNAKDFPGKVKMYTPKSYTNDQYGYQFIPSLIKQEKPDIVLTSIDFHRSTPFLEELKKLQFTQSFRWVNYFPMDREDFKAAEIAAFRYPDVNVCITKFGVDVIKSINPKLDIKQIYHPLDPTDFPKIEKKDLDGYKVNSYPDTTKDTFVVGTVNRSFSRKDTPRLVVAFSEHLKQNPKDFAYLHGSHRTFEGLDLRHLAVLNGAPKGRMAFMPDNLQEFHGVDQQLINAVYRSMDLFVTVSSGEGFGFSTVEAMLTSTPIIAPHNTCFPELVQDFGYLIPTAGMAFHHNSNAAMWPIVNIADVVSQMQYVKDNYPEAKAKAKAGRKWVIDNLNLKTIAEKWRQILQDED